MDRTLKVYSKTGHLFAEFTFNYEDRQQASVHYVEYHPLSNDDEEYQSTSVIPGMEMDTHLPFIQFDSIEKIKAYDKEVVKKEMGRYMKDAPDTYKYVYDPDPILQRYVVDSHRGSIGMINVLYSFIENTKEVKFLSATHPRFDVDISADSLETNISCIMRIPVYLDRDEMPMGAFDIKKLPVWY
jgi:hypothetical protein